MPFSLDPESAQIAARTSLLRRFAASRGGRLHESERSQLVTQTCLYRPRECVALLAQWRHEAPSSPARERIETGLRESVLLSRMTDLELVEPLSRLYGDGGGAADAERGLEHAVQASERFAGYYHHGAPFSRAALAEIWNRCEQDGPEQRERCRRALAQTQSRLGDLGLPAPGAAGGG
jgi:hypothetical protein